MTEPRGVIRRFSNHIIGCPGCGEPRDDLRDDSDGAFVLYEDYARLHTALERVLHYWQERYGMEFEKTDEVLIDEVRRVQRALSATPEPRDG